MASRPHPSKAGGKTPGRTAAQERERLAQRLHDTVCQELTGIGFLAVAAAHQHRARDPQAEQQFREIADLIQRASVHLAEIVHGLRAPGGGEEN